MQSIPTYFYSRRIKNREVVEVFSPQEAYIYHLSLASLVPMPEFHRALPNCVDITKIVKCAAPGSPLNVAQAALRRTNIFGSNIPTLTLITCPTVRVKLKLQPQTRLTASGLAEVVT